MIQSEGYIQAVLESQQVLFLLGDPKHFFENITLITEYKNSAIQLFGSMNGEVTSPVVHVGPSHQVGLINPLKLNKITIENNFTEEITKMSSHY